ncbi:MAG: glycosyltransferase [Bacteroidota bacterium]|nr:glycosyltransferase [Bacteroidota bacterium]MDX5447760.1 glycosyltransferase [Bacteroidota bacterium]
MSTFGGMGTELWLLILCMPIIVYGAMMVTFRYRFREFPNGSDDHPKPKVSVIIPFRNEHENLLDLFTSLENLSIEIPDEVIWVDDGSTDDGATVLEALFLNSRIPHKLIRIEGSGKKPALDAGIRASLGDWILTTDADCKVPTTWVNDLVLSIRSAPERSVWCGPVTFKKGSLWQRMQSLDFLALVASSRSMINMGFPVMANGSNLAFRRMTYLDLSQALLSRSHPGGDDTFLVQEVALTLGSNRVGYVPTQNTVETTAPSTLKSWWDQRIRWASKTPGYSYYPAKAVALVVFLANFIPWIMVFLDPWFAVWVMGIKVINEAFFLQLPMRYYRRNDLWWMILPQGVFNYFYIPIVGLFSLLAPVRWK